MSWKNLVLGAVVMCSVLACGGGGQSSTGTFQTAGNAAFGGGASNAAAGASSPGTGGGNSSTNTAGTVAMLLSSNTISASNPATVTAVVKDAAGAVVPGALIQFSLTGGASGAGATGLATVSPSSALTDANGQAVATLAPATGATSGAAYISAVADTTAGSLTVKKAFSVVATNVSLSAVDLPNTTINGYDTTSINVTVAGASTTTPATVNVTSTCASGSKATISPASLTLTGPTGSFTYQDKGCGSTSGTGSTVDRIHVQIVGTTQQMYKDLTVNAPVTTGIQFVSVDNPVMCLMGTGCPSVANVVFKVVDQTGVPQQGVQVDFSLNLNASVATLGATFGVTGADGTVSVAVASKKTPTPIRVGARVRNTSVQTLSSQLTISGGLPVAANFRLNTFDSRSGISLGASVYALDAHVNGSQSELFVFLTDRYGAPAVDGTVVNFVTDGGTVIPATCQSKDGRCKVTLIVSNPKPLNGRVHMTAYAYGQEYFVDANGNGFYDNGEAYEDVPSAVCVDKDDSNSCDAASEFIVGNFQVPDGGSGSWDDAGAAFAQFRTNFVFASTTGAPRFFTVDSNGNCTPVQVTTAGELAVTMNGKTSAEVKFCLRDANIQADSYGGNSIATGSSVAGTPSLSAAKVIVDNASTPSQVAPVVYTLTVQTTSTSSAASTSAPPSGSIDVTVTMGGRPYSFPGWITINP
jgi:hypothetical protein